MTEIVGEERVSEAEVYLGSWLDSRAEITSKVSARDHLVVFGILPGFPLSIFRIWLLKYCILPKIRKQDTKGVRGETCSVTSHQANTPTPKSRFQLNTTILS